MTDRLLRTTSSLCAVCKQATPAEVWREGDHVVMRKRCVLHGASEVLVSPNAAWYESVIGCDGKSFMRFIVEVSSAGSEPKRAPV